MELTMAKKTSISKQKSQSSSNIKTINPSSSKKVGSNIVTKQIVTLSHEQIAERAKTLWMNQGCPFGQDEQNWFEAESQLKQELGLK